MPKSNTLKKNIIKEPEKKKSASAAKKNHNSKKSKPISKTKKSTPPFYKDPRFVIIFGIFLIITSLYLFTSFSSYLYNYLPLGAGSKNAGGYFGLAVGSLFIQQWFGMGSFVFTLWAIIPGLKMAFNIELKRPMVFLWHTIFWLIWLPVVLALVCKTEPWDVLGGAFGLFLSDLLHQTVGMVFSIVILAFLLISYLILGFNIHLKISLPKNIGKRNHHDKGIKKSGAEPKEDIFNTNEFAVDDEEIPLSTPTTGIKEDIVEVQQEIQLPEGTDNTLELETPKTQNKKPIAKSLDHDIELSVEQTKVEEQVKPTKKPLEHYGIDTAYDPHMDLPDFVFPKIDFLVEYSGGAVSINKQELEENKNKIVKTLNNYSIKIDQIKATVGPTITLYEIIPAPGIRISKIKNLEDDIALSLSALGIRIIAPIPGKGTIGIEVPNRKPMIVSMRAIIGSAKFQENKYELPIGLGKTISNESYVADLTKMPHLLIAGATGQGKSVGLNAIITSLLYQKHPSELKFILVDPKKVELTLFNKIERHYLAKLPDSEEAIITDTRMVVRTLNSLILEMENRYNLLKDAQVRNIKEYNAKFIKRRLNPQEGHRFLPYIVLIVDEFADLIMTAGKEIEQPITRLAQLARAIGIHLIIATQRPSVNIITGTIKANFPARVAFRVVSKMDSRTILDTGGADQLVGRGDMLLSTGNDLIRLQCAFIDTPEVDEITDFIGAQRGYPEAFALPEVPDEDGNEVPEIDSSDRDPLFEDAAHVIVSNQHGSTSLLQRKLKLGYNRAGRIIDQLEAVGIVGPFEGSKAREVRVGSEMALEQFLKDLYAKENGTNLPFPDDTL